jgi:hypothetical protein
MSASFYAQLARWGFKPVDSNGQPQPDEHETPTETKPAVDPREIAKALLNGDGEVNL